MACRLIAPVLSLALVVCRPATSEVTPTEPTERDESVPEATSPGPSTSTPDCPRPAALDNPDTRADLPLAEHAFTRCDVELSGTILDQAVYEAQVECADPPGRPALDFAKVRLVAVRLEEPSSLLGATREPGSTVTRVHLIDHAYCGGVDPGSQMHIVVIPADGSEIEIDVCREAPGCGDLAPPSAE